MIVWFVLGPIGAGKSTFIQEILLKEEKKGVRLQYLSADVLKKRDNLTYIEARKKMEQIIREHVERGIDFVTEGTGQHDDMYGLFESYKKNPGIELRVTYIDIDIEVALERNKKRTRVLPDDVVREVHENSRKRKGLWKDFGCEYVDYRDLHSDDMANSDIF